MNTEAVGVGGSRTSPPLFEVRDLQVWFDLNQGGTLHAVRGIDFSVERGTRFGLVGESGCGKSTALMAMLGLLPPNAAVAGSIRYEGEEILTAGERAIQPHRWRDIAMVFQGAMNALNPVRTVGAQIVEPMELHGIARGKAARQRARELLELVGIAGSRAERYPHEFSGGMRQRVCIAMALACDPSVLIADEPTTALDVMVQAQILDLLTDLTEQLSLALIVVSHDLPVIGQVCHEAAVMYAGQIVESGPIDELFHDPRHPYTRLLFAATPSVSDPEGSVVSIPGSPPRLDQPLVGCPFEPRCDASTDLCRDVAPEVEPLDARRTAMCHLATGKQS